MIKYRFASLKSPKVDQSEISLRARGIPLIDQSAAAAVDGGTCGLKSDDSDDQLGQDSRKKDFNEKNENSNFLGTAVEIPGEVTCEPASGMRDRIYWAFSDAPLLTQAEANDGCAALRVKVEPLANRLSNRLLKTQSALHKGCFLKFTLPLSLTTVLTTPPRHCPHR